MCQLESVQPAVRLAAAAGIAALETALSPMEPERKDAAGRGAEKKDDPRRTKRGRDEL